MQVGAQAGVAAQPVKTVVPANIAPSKAATVVYVTTMIHPNLKQKRSQNSYK